MGAHRWDPLNVHGEARSSELLKLCRETPIAFGRLMLSDYRT